MTKTIYHFVTIKKWNFKFEESFFLLFRSQAQTPPLQSYVITTDPFDDERPRTTTAPQLINHSGLTIPQPIENVDGSIDHTSRY